MDEDIDGHTVQPKLEGSFTAGREAINPRRFRQTTDPMVDPDDLRQEAEAGLWFAIRRRPVYGGDEGARRLASTIHRHAGGKAIDRARKHEHDSLDELAERHGEAGLPGASTLRPTEDAVLRVELQQLLVQTKLSEKERQVLLLRYLSGLDCEEVAQVLGITANNVRVLAHRALRKLKAAVDRLGLAIEDFSGEANR